MKMSSFCTKKLDKSNAYTYAQNKGKIVRSDVQNKGKTLKDTIINLFAPLNKQNENTNTNHSINHGRKYGQHHVHGCKCRYKRHGHFGCI